MFKSTTLLGNLGTLLAIVRTASAQAQTLSAQDIARRMIERHAVEAVIWGMPAVNTDLMYQAMLKLGGKPNQIVYWSGLLDWRNQTLTPNPDVIYLMAFFSTKDGPVVIEIPPAGDGVINGSIMDPWQTALEDVGPAGVDKGAGGKYLITPPGYQGAAPGGYIVLPCANYQGYALLRSILKSGGEADVKAAVAYGRRIRIYPLSQAANPPETVFVDAIGTIYDSTIPYDISFFQSLDRFVQREPWLTRDKAMIDPLKGIGIEKDKPFNPDEATKGLLNAAAGEAHAWLNLQYETMFSPYYEGRRWVFPIAPEVINGLQTQFADPDSYPVEGRGVTYTMAFFSTKHSGVGQFYLMTIKDKDGQSFVGANTYRLTVPANAPVRQYWSATVYDRATHALIREMPRAGRSSQSSGLQANADGSVDIWFGPKAPAGKENNWAPTSANGQFEVLFRFYGPEKPVFDKTWQLPDIERIAAQ
ncbi:DUF1254 domain-containing protein [Bradyrhizobium canariense]|uniref:Uncharacterized conserved protein n=1 Tax=Bradyrhizobium canariense TaxID=255045 RepID=A0A1H1PDJ1_9BRAD|nr:DUF1254 domain-containing protein [Bradyrhizobium canariense]SDS09312.1 Uncharacterized conserved protein [Bradyrhizobium canariense]